VQLLLQFPVLVRYKMRFRLDFNFRGDLQLKRILLLMLPGIAGVAIYQINIIVTRLMASFLPDGSVSYLYYGQRLFEFPQGIFIVSLAQAALPMMSRQVAEKDDAGLRESLNFAMTLVTIFTLPAIIGLVLCARPIYSVFFLGGEFSVTALENTALALICYAPGLIFVGYSRIAAQTFYALKDTRTPVVISFWTLLVNLVAGLVLMQFYGFAGLAIALTLASVFNAVMLLILLQRKIGLFLHASLFVPILKVIPACLLMAVAVHYALGTTDWAAAGGLLAKGALLIVTAAGGAGLYLGCCYLFNVDEVRRGWQLLRKRKELR